MDTRILYLALMAAIIFTGCKKAYNPQLVSAPDSYLVIEGLVNSGTDSTIIKLSRTTPVYSTKTNNAEVNASVKVEGEDGTSYLLKETDSGTYASTGLNLNPLQKYRLRVTTIANDVYVSDFEAVKATPPIDSIGYIIKADGLQIYSNAHDASNNTRYYRFEYIEDWKFNSAYRTNLEVVGNEIVGRAVDVYYCYNNDQSSNVIIGSTVKLSQDVLYQQPLIQIPAESEKISNRYAILVKQYSLTKNAYTFWQQVKNNTEKLGSIFDPQPSEAAGNIKCISNPTKKVIGYISVGTAQTKRIYIDKAELPATWLVNYGCSIDTAFFAFGGTKALFNQPPSAITLNRAFNGSNDWVGYLTTSPICTICTIRGKLQKPAFWVDAK
jgi:hypothetical protein